MKLAALIPREAIVAELESIGKESVLREMTDILVRAGKIAKGSAPGVVGALMRREEFGSTGIGKGVAVPHARHDGVAKESGGLVAAFGRSSKGVEFAALDGQPVRLVFLLVHSGDNSGKHLEALARVARLAKDVPFCRFLSEAKDADELAELLAEADARLDEARA